MTSLIGYYNHEMEIFSQIMEFENDQIGIASLRRAIRDMFIKKEITLDSLREQELVVIGWFNRKTGELMQDEDYEIMGIPLESFVQDLVMEDD